MRRTILVVLLLLAVVTMLRVGARPAVQKAAPPETQAPLGWPP